MKKYDVMIQVSEWTRAAAYDCLTALLSYEFSDQECK